MFCSIAHEWEQFIPLTIRNFTLHYLTQSGLIYFAPLHDIAKGCGVKNHHKSSQTVAYADDTNILASSTKLNEAAGLKINEEKTRKWNTILNDYDSKKSIVLY